MSLSLSNSPLVVYINTEYVILSMRFLTRWLTSSDFSALSMALWNTTLKAYRNRSGICIHSAMMACTCTYQNSIHNNEHRLSDGGYFGTRHQWNRMGKIKYWNTVIGISFIRHVKDGRYAMYIIRMLLCTSGWYMFKYKGTLSENW